MTQNVDLQVKVKFVVDPKDLQAALSGGGSGGASSAGPSSAGGGPRGRSVGHAAGLPFLSPAGPVGDRAWFAIEEERRKLLSAGNQAEKRRQGEKDKIHRDWLKTEEELRKLNLQAAQFEKRKIQDEQQMARRSQLSGRRAGKGYGSEGMFAAGTSPIMQGLAWQSLFATGDILGPMAFAPMALYQNYSLKRQRRNRGFDLGAGSDLAKAAGVGDTGQIATAGHALAALRNNAALTPAEREKRMAQVDIMSAGRVRGRLGRNIEMFESGQLGGKGMRALGTKVGELGGVSSVALGAAAGLGAVGIAAISVNQNLAAFAGELQSASEAARASSRAARLSLQERAAGNMPAAARNAALEKRGLQNVSERYKDSVLRLSQRGMSNATIEELITKAEAAEASGVGVTADAVLAAATKGGGPLGKRSAAQQYAFAGRGLLASGDLARQSKAEFLGAPSATIPGRGSVGYALQKTQWLEKRGAERQATRFAGELQKGAQANYDEIMAPGTKAIKEFIAASEAKVRVLQAEAQATFGVAMFMQDFFAQLGMGQGSAAVRAGRERASQSGLLEVPLGDRQ